MLGWGVVTPDGLIGRVATGRVQLLVTRWGGTGDTVGIKAELEYAPTEMATAAVTSVTGGALF